MKTRIIAAAILVPLLLLLVLVAPILLAAIVFGLLMAIGAYEFLYRTGLVRRIRLVVYSAVAAFMVSIWSAYDAVQAYLLLGLVVFFILLYSDQRIAASMPVPSVRNSDKRDDGAQCAPRAENQMDISSFSLLARAASTFLIYLSSIS